MAPLPHSHTPLTLQVHVFDMTVPAVTPSSEADGGAVKSSVGGAFLQSFPGHRDVISALAFRDGTHQVGVDGWLWKV